MDDRGDAGPVEGLGSLEEMTEALQERIGPALDEIDTTARRLVEEHPLATLAGAAAAGYLLGRLLARR